MDGASKFVRGDAIAGILITFINVLGGIIIGVAQQDMSFGDAADTYTRLTVETPSFSNPALIVSTAAGMMVTQAGIGEKTESALINQLGGQPKALGIVSFLMAGLGTPLACPFFPFSFLAA